MQLVLPIAPRPRLTRADFIAAPGNEKALAFLESWPNWPAPAAVLHGPAASGKSHLVQIWAARTDATVIGAAELADAPDGPVAVEGGDAVAGSGHERALFSLFDVQTFVTRDLKLAMETYFSQVTVVPAGTELPATPHVVADVKIDDLRLAALNRGGLTYQLIEMTWSFALRPNEAADYTYSFAGASQSNDSYPTFEAGVASLEENALTAMLKKWVEAQGIETLRKLD